MVSMHFILLRKVKRNTGTKNWLLMRPVVPPPISWLVVSIQDVLPLPIAILWVMCSPDLGQLSCSTELCEDFSVTFPMSVSA